MMIKAIVCAHRFFAAVVIAAGLWLITGCKQSKPAVTLGDEGPFPGFEGATDWINTQPLSKESLKGKVVLVDFWTYSCINCLRSLPYVKAWHDKYKDLGLVVVGVHTPEFDFERERVNVAQRMEKLGITYPVAMDNDMAVWNAFRNQYWPAHYFVDANGRIRYHHFGEGKYEESERVIQQFLEDAGAKNASSMGIVQVAAKGAQAATKNPVSRYSPETYLGTQRAKNFASPEKLVVGGPWKYTEPDSLAMDSWALTGTWKVTPKDVQLMVTPGAISYKFRGRDLHLVMGSLDKSKPVRFRITLDGKAPLEGAGADVTADGTGVVKDYRLYQLVRLKGGSGIRTFRIEFLEPGVRAYAFTFG
jgi:thiol-disulfide isomerase/thioredoxin